MVFWIFVIILVVGMIGVVALENDYEHDMLLKFSIATLIIGGLVSLFMTILIVFAHVDADATLKKYEEHYKSMMYQYTNNIYDNDNDLGKRELMVEIALWNEAVVYKQEVEKDFWIGIFYPNIHDQLKTIELKGEK